jgi:hypothetical protein
VFAYLLLSQREANMLWEDGAATAPAYMKLQAILNTWKSEGYPEQIIPTMRRWGAITQSCLWIPPGHEEFAALRDNAWSKNLEVQQP